MSVRPCTSAVAAMSASGVAILKRLRVSPASSAISASTPISTIDPKRRRSRADSSRPANNSHLVTTETSLGHFAPLMGQGSKLRELYLSLGRGSDAVDPVPVLVKDEVGNTFADVGRQIVTVLFADLPTTRRREVMSAAAHYIAGVLDREAMVEIVERLGITDDFKSGDAVTTLRGSARGVVVRVLPDGRVVWGPNGGETELFSLPENLLRV